ncbi:FUSC family protein [Aquincola sp. MAHUQ-54]|uniref:FUSC family protein n=1 Tax=Aquincola agrisoli TaxID=3119538 RepID=A0AAW9Q9X0_9BURK
MLTAALRRRWPWHVPAHGVNGISVAMGVLLVQLVSGLLGGPAAAFTASGGAIFASLADTPNPPRRTWRRVGTAAAAGFVSSVLVMMLRTHDLALGGLVTVLAFVSSLMLAWGVRAGPISFVPMLAVVFTMAAPPLPGWMQQAEHAGWTAFGSGLYLAWSVLAARVLQPRYRGLALAGVLEATAALLRSRSALLLQDRMRPEGAPPLQDWMARQVLLDERLQTARDLLFEAADAPDAPRRIAVLLLAIDLRDTLLGSELDLDLLGHDAPAERLRSQLAATVDAAAGALDRMALALQLGLPGDAPSVMHRPALTDAVEQFGAEPSRRALATALLDRSRHIADDLGRMQAALAGIDVPKPLSPEELRFFVSPEGWPLAALKLHLRMSSPILRHAIRSAVALGAAYFLALALPWASHPHWLVLSVAVVLRGNLDQTLSRRDARVAGTVLGCLLVLLLSLVHAPLLSSLVFLVAAGTAHAFVNVRYLVTATAATVMALVQAHLADPSGGFGVGERLADTVLGALLAWGFSYVLPAWERRGLGRLVDRVQASLRALVREALRWPEPGERDVALRLARREVYEAIGGIAASAQRTRAEPQSVQVPLYAMATLLTQCHVLLAQLAAVRTMLTRRADRLDRAASEEALRTAAADIDRLLDAADPQSAAPEPQSGDTVQGVGELRLPPLTVNEPLLPWLQRRLRLARQGAARVAAAAGAVRAAQRRR